MKLTGIKVILLFSSLLVAGSAFGDNLLRFNPPDSVSFRGSSRTVRNENRNGLKLVDTTETQSEGRIVKTPEGWTITTTIKSARLAPGADSLKKTLSDLLIGTETLLYINTQGRALRITGYDEMMARLNVGEQTPIKSAIRQVFTPKAMADRDLSDWDTRIGALAGRRLTIGHLETRQAESPAEAGTNLTLLSATIIEDTVRIGGVLCVKVGLFSDSDPTLLAGELHKSVPEVIALYHLSDSAAAALKRQDIVYSSHLHMTVEVATLLKRAETMVRSMTVAVPGKDGKTLRRQTQETVEKAISYY